MGDENWLGRCAKGIVEDYCEKYNSLVSFLSHTGSEIQGVSEQKEKTAKEKQVLKDLSDLTSLQFFTFPLNGKYLTSKDHGMSLAFKLSALLFVPLNFIVALTKPN